MNESKWRDPLDRFLEWDCVSTEISCCPDAKQKQKSFGGKPGGGDLLVSSA